MLLPKPSIEFKHQLLLSVLLVICCVPVGMISWISAQQCNDLTIHPLASELINRTPDADGIIHVTYSFADPSISAEEKASIQTAITEWNNFSSSTRVRFDETPPGASADFDFAQSDDENLTGGCAGYDPRLERINYSPAWRQRAQASSENGASDCT
jgi:hypothetical protein